MRYLITGAAGFIGFYVSRLLLERGDVVVGVDSLNDYYDPALKAARLEELGISADPAFSGSPTTSARYPGFIFQRLDIADESVLKSVFDAHAFDGVVNLAAQAGVRYSIENPQAYIDSNIQGFLSVLERCRTHRIAHLVFASSSSVYGLNADRPFSVHRGADHPVSLYAATKRSNELMAHAYAHLYGLPVTGLRFFTVYGPWGRPDMAYFKFAQAIWSGKPIDVYNNGDMYRDFTYIDDVAEGVVRVLDRPAVPSGTFNPRQPDPSISSAPYRLYNIGHNHPEKLADFISTLETCLGKTAEKRYLPMQDGDVYATAADIDDLKSDFGWSPSTDIRTGLRRFTDWFKATLP